MLKPATLQEFKQLIESMAHRERFVFELADDQPTNECNAFMELYSTELFGEIGRRKQQVLYQTVGYGGKFNKKFNSKTSQLMRITTDKWLDSAIYSRIK